jgi:hypothetical protein
MAGRLSPCRLPDEGFQSTWQSADQGADAGTGERFGKHPRNERSTRQVQNAADDAEQQNEEARDDQAQDPKSDLGQADPRPRSPPLGGSQRMSRPNVSRITVRTPRLRGCG